MCQSKSEGGARCESHAKKAVAEHQIAYSNLVQQECLANGIIIDPTCFELTPEETSKVSLQLSADPAVQKAHDEVYRPKQQFEKIRRTLTEALGSGDINRLAMVIRQYNPEFQAINDDNETRRLKFADAMAKATNEKETDEANAYNKNTSALLNDRKAKLNFLSKKEAVNAANIYHRTGDSSKAVTSLTCLQKANEENIAARETALSKIASIREQMNKMAIANKLINDPGFQEVESSPAFRNSPALHKWEAKEKELTENYRMTSGYQNQLAAKISDYKKAGMDTTEMELRYKALTIQKAKIAYKNIAEFHGPSSPQAKTAIENYKEVKQKQHTF